MLVRTWLVGHMQVLHGRGMLHWLHWLRYVREKEIMVRQLYVSYLSYCSPVADSILNSQVAAMVESIESVAVVLGLGEEPYPVRTALIHQNNFITYFQLVLSGGVLTHSGSLVAEKLQKRLAEKLPQAQIRFPELSPEEAAAYLIMTATV